MPQGCRSGEQGISALFANCNRGKRSVRVDLKTEAGRDIVEELAAGADVVLTNFRPGVMDGLGLGSDHLRALHPRLIYAGASHAAHRAQWLRRRPAEATGRREAIDQAAMG